MVGAFIFPSLFHLFPSFPCLLRMKPWNPDWSWDDHGTWMGSSQLTPLSTRPGRWLEAPPWECDFSRWLGRTADSGMGRHGTLKPQMLNGNLGVPQWTSSLVDPGLGSLIVIAFMVRVLVRQWSSHFSAVEMIGDEMLRKCGYVGIFYNVYPRNIYQVFRESQEKLTKLSSADQPDSIDLRDDPGICLVDEVVLWLSRSVRGTLHGNVPFGRSAGRPRTPPVQFFWQFVGPVCCWLWLRDSPTEREYCLASAANNIPEEHTDTKGILRIKYGSPIQDSERQELLRMTI